MEVLETAESFEEVDEEYKFSQTLIVYRMDNRIYHALSQARYSATKVNIECLTDKIQVPIAAYQPLFPPNLTRAPDPLPVDSYVKRPRLISYDRLRNSSRPTHIADQVLKEAEVCEILQRHPHPNIAKYLGCEVHNGRITGICFVKYPETLMQRVNPRGHMKRAYRHYSQTLADRDSILDGIESGIHHLHSLGLIHNDINPSNIMLNGNTPVIIDFNSCRPTGESLDWTDIRVVR